MAMRVNWIRDEVILALDVLFAVKGKSLSIDDPVIIDLSALLNRIPIVPAEKRNNTFRNTAGVSQQLSRFKQSFIKDKDTVHIGDLFFCVYDEFKNKTEWLHGIAQAIRHCEGMINSICFGDESEMMGFPEGAILGHLHRFLERTNRFRHLLQAGKCTICGIKPEHIYQVYENLDFMEAHLLIPPEKYQPDMVIGKSDFTMVCPNCHSVLHQKRPWLGSDEMKEILRRS